MKLRLVKWNGDFQIAINVKLADGDLEIAINVKLADGDLEIAVPFQCLKKARF